jgi:hypothetical protein
MHHHILKVYALILLVMENFCKDYLVKQLFINLSEIHISLQTQVQGSGLSGNLGMHKS